LLVHSGCEGEQFPACKAVASPGHELETKRGTALFADKTLDFEGALRPLAGTLWKLHMQAGSVFARLSAPDLPHATIRPG